ncbi:DUF2971 domain-containing protein [Laribacter hongkongensis]|uniref:DUF2971 domain-containing protein n=1 Tax=Laribacter hongkongensis TaxID=168471 RepID=UPI0009DB8B0F|nr:DUF2971 domain-containing protein [Laribacter hongkongensis]
MPIINDLNLQDVSPVPTDLDLPSTVYKYREINDRLYESITLNQIYIPAPSTFNDPFDSSKILSRTAFGEILHRNINESGMLCLCKFADNLPMWAYYGDGLKGVSIGYDLKMLLHSLKPLKPNPNEYSPRYRYVFDVQYCSGKMEPIREYGLLNNDDREIQKMYATKSTAFQHENECRIMVPASPDINGDCTWVGYGMYTHAPEAIKEIIFGIGVLNEKKQAIMEMLKNRNISFKQAIPIKENFGLTIEPLTA